MDNTAPLNIEDLMVTRGHRNTLGRMDTLGRMGRMDTMGRMGRGHTSIPTDRIRRECTSEAALPYSLSLPA
ncbi:MAG: hypothetical protein LBJ48_01290 [Coriobacteriales bacterium]|jgi:hypothetical protein|nr:hypothetical protein [Coriobacteriales bacterium]